MVQDGAHCLSVFISVRQSFLTVNLSVSVVGAAACVGSWGATFLSVPINPPFCLSVCLPTSAAAYVPSIVLERPVFIRERSDGLYSVTTYLCHKMVEEILLAFAYSLLFGMLVYLLVKLQVGLRERVGV
jgi:ABC-2 type transporter